MQDLHRALQAGALRHYHFMIGLGLWDWMAGSAPLDALHLHWYYRARGRGHQERARAVYARCIWARGRGVYSVHSHAAEPYECEENRDYCMVANNTACGPLHG